MQATEGDAAAQRARGDHFERLFREEARKVVTAREDVREGAPGVLARLGWCFKLLGVLVGVLACLRCGMCCYGNIRVFDWAAVNQQLIYCALV